MDLFALALVTAIIAIWYLTRSEGLSNKPNEQQLRFMADEVMRNKELFEPGAKLNDAKQKIRWLDVISFEDLRELARYKKLNGDNIQSALVQ